MRRVALVTGAASGIGHACAKRLAAQGMMVVSLDRNEVPGPPGPTVVYDLADLEGLRSMLDQVTAEVGPVDVLVNCAGMFSMSPVSTVTVEDLRRILDVNLLAGVMLAILVAPGMRERGWGRIVSISSVKDQLGSAGTLGYDITKAALSQAMRSLAAELGGDGVLVNAVAPGFIRTGMSIVDGVSELETEEFHRHFIESGRLPLARGGSPEEIAGCVAWLAGDDSSYVNGAIVRVDGGLSATI